MRSVAAWVACALAAAVVLVGCTTPAPEEPAIEPGASWSPGERGRTAPVEPVTVDPTPPEPPASGVVSPADFGAAGDGVTDDAAALQAAVDAAAQSDKRVVLDARTYLLRSSLELPSGTWLSGRGDASVLEFTWRNNDPTHDGYYVGNADQTTAGNTDITLKDFAIRGAAPGTPAGPKALLVEPNVPAIRFRLVDRFAITGLDIGYAPGISIIHQGSSNGRIAENDIHHSGRDGINGTWHKRNMHDILIEDNTIEKIGDDAVAVIGAPGRRANRERLPYRIVVRDNVVRGWSENPNGLALGRGISVLAATRVRLEGNVIDRTHSSGILIAPSTREFSVDPDTRMPWRSSNIQVTGNRIVEAGQNFVGSKAEVGVPGHDGILVKSSDEIYIWDNHIVRPFGEAVALFDCRRCEASTDG